MVTAIVELCAVVFSLKEKNSIIAHYFIQFMKHGSHTWFKTTLGHCVPTQLHGYLTKALATQLGPGEGWAPLAANSLSFVSLSP